MMAILLMVMGFVGFEANMDAASVTYYQTVKADVPIWSAASSSSTKKRT